MTSAAGLTSFVVAPLPVLATSRSLRSGSRSASRAGFLADARESARRGKLRGMGEGPAMKIDQVMGLLPHRYPFLLIDRVLELSDERLVALKEEMGYRCE